MARASVVYGPVPSRRFGFSLGVDVIPHKYCNYDCIYCQLGPTTNHTMQRRNFSNTEQILADLRAAFESDPCPDVITLAGSGEPTLHEKVGSIIRDIADITDIPIVLLTNGGLLFREEIRSAVYAADILAPSLDAGDEKTFHAINQPCRDIDFAEMVDGIRIAVHEFSGIVRLETMLIHGINTNDTQLDDLVRLIETIDPRFVDINTPVRPNPRRSFTPCPPEILRDFSDRLGRRAKIIVALPGDDEIVRRYQPDELGERILRMLSRRPCSPEDISAVTGAHRNHVLKILSEFEREGRVESRKVERKIFFFAPQ